jgi:multiple sugar transport system substrate-binding protein
MQRARTGGALGGTKFSRRRFLKMGGTGLAGAALLGSGALAGCGGGGAEGDDIIFSWGPDATGVLPKMIDALNKQSDGFKVNYREMPSDTGEYFDQLRTQFQAGASDIDVIGGDVIWPAQFAGNGYIADLSDRFTDSDEFLPAPLEAMRYEDGIFGVPWYTDAGLLYYRKDLLEKAGFSEPPKTWEELIEQAKKAQQDEGLPFGFVFRGRSTRAACAMGSSTSGPPAATCSTRTTRAGSWWRAPSPWRASHHRAVHDRGRRHHPRRAPVPGGRVPWGLRARGLRVLAQLALRLRPLLRPR